MEQKRQVLEFIRERTREGLSVSYRTLERRCDMSPETACDYLKRLWRERLIETSERPPRFHYRLGPGESIRDLRFQLSRRGKERLAWYAERDREEEEDSLL